MKEERRRGRKVERKRPKVATAYHHSLVTAQGIIFFNDIFGLEYYFNHWKCQQAIRVVL